MNGTGLPVLMSNAKMLFAAISPGPPIADARRTGLAEAAGDVDGVADDAWLQTTPLTCQVGSASAVTVVCVRRQRCHRLRRYGGDGAEGRGSDENAGKEGADARGQPGSSTTHGSS